MWIVEPSVAITVRSTTMRTARATTVSGSWMTAPALERGVSDPSGSYARSANASATTRSPAARPAAMSREPGGPNRASPRSNVAIAPATALAS